MPLLLLTNMESLPLRIIRSACKTPLGSLLSNAVILRRLPAAYQTRLRTTLNFVRFRERLLGGSWSWAWGEELPVSYSACGATNAPGGSVCLRFEWRRADWDGTRRTMSAELFTGHFAPAASLTYSYRVWLPPDCEQFSVPVILSQTHDMPDFALSKSWRRPISEVRLQGGVAEYIYRGITGEVTPLRWDQSSSYSSEQTVPLGRPKFGDWNEFKIVEHLSPLGRHGCIRVQMNESVVTRRGIHVGFNDVVGPYWKFGPYLPIMEGAPAGIVLYYDRINIWPARRKRRDRC